MEKVVSEEEESFFTLLLNNQNGYSLSVADALVGQSFEMHDVNMAQVDEEPPKQATSEPDEPRPPIRFRKAIPPHVLRDLTVRDPKRARRIIANRLSAARAKEKKKMHIQMLENEVQNLQAKWNATSTQLAFVQNEGEELNEESSRLKERVTMILQRISLQDELNEQIRKEVQYLKSTIGYSGINYDVSGEDSQPDIAGDAQPENGTQQ